MFAPPLLGHDGRPGNSATVPFQREVERLAGTIRRRFQKPVHLAGYSLGARLALGLLVTNQALVHSATLIGVHPGLRSDLERARRLRADERWCRLALEQGIAAFVDQWTRQTLFATQRQLAPGVRAAQRSIRLSHHPAGLALSLDSLGLARMPSYWDSLPRITVRVHLMTGQLDTKFTALGARAASAMRSQLTVVEGAGHNLVLEAPHAVVAALQEGITL